VSISSEQVVKVGDYEVPAELLRLTGCAEEIFESYGAAQFNRFREELNIQPGNTVLEIGCGVGRLAIPATHYLDSSGAYIGMDIIKPSIDWCSTHITARHPAFQFFAEDVYSQIHNPGGSKHCADVVFPLQDQFVDKIFLSSVFTHMFPADVTHYLGEMNRVLKPDGAVLTTMFLLNDLTLATIAAKKAIFSFDHSMPEWPQCRFQYPATPEGAIAYFEEKYLHMLYASGFQLKKPIEYGQWSGVGTGLTDGQDYVIFGKV
jgi:SAM-dependent methyltransferase